MDKITPRAELHFTGAKSGKPYHLHTNQTVEVDLADLAHVDPKDFVVGDKPEEVEQPKGKKK
jgi:hypothetical protein